ncbi:MAG: hypothetical protein GTN76_14830 [Candidatus Aenigmarchaeota archaeon]|nr:hypothetical protein [Candidatus Aenigmarchaeota archaeon]
MGKSQIMEAKKIIYLDDHDRPTSKEKATQVRILLEEEGERIEVYGIITPPKES